MNRYETLKTINNWHYLGVNHSTSRLTQGAFISTTQPGAALATEATSEGHRPGQTDDGNQPWRSIAGKNRNKKWWII